MLVRLMYASRTTAPLDPEAMHALLRQCKENNPTQGVTGLLCHCSSNGIFMQALEGGRSAVNRLYNRIATDPRHTDVLLLSYEEITERRFAGWSMGQVNMSRLNPGLVLKYCETGKLDPYNMTGHALMALFNELVGSGAIVCS